MRRSAQRKNNKRGKRRQWPRQRRRRRGRRGVESEKKGDGRRGGGVEGGACSSHVTHGVLNLQQAQHVSAAAGGGWLGGRVERGVAMDRNANDELSSGKAHRASHL